MQPIGNEVMQPKNPNLKKVTPNQQKRMINISKIGNRTQKTIND